MSRLQNVNSQSIDNLKNPDYATFMFTGDQIKALRERLALTPTQFAYRLGVSPSAVCLWEKGDRHPRYAIMVKLNELAREQTNGQTRKRQPA